jgi:hypothetical protein
MMLAVLFQLIIERSPFFNYSKRAIALSNNSEGRSPVLQSEERSLKMFPIHN